MFLGLKTEIYFVQLANDVFGPKKMGFKLMGIAINEAIRLIAMEKLGSDPRLLDRYREAAL